MVCGSPWRSHGCELSCGYFPCRQKKMSSHTQRPILHFIFSLPSWLICSRRLCTGCFWQTGSIKIEPQFYLCWPFLPFHNRSLSHLHFFFFRIKPVYLFMWLITGCADVPVDCHSCQLFLFCLLSKKKMELLVFVTHTAAEYSIMGWRSGYRCAMKGILCCPRGAGWSPLVKTVV